MSTPDRDLEEFLRRGLHAAAESIEPAPGGLEVIRRRVASHRLQRQARLLLTDCADLVLLLMIWLEPAMSWLARSVRSRTAGVHREDAHPGHRVRRPGVARPLSDWLRPSMVVATAVVIVVAGVFGLARLRQQPVTNLGNFSQGGATSSSSSTHTARESAAGTASSAVPPRSSNPAVAPASGSSPSHSTSGPASPKPSCQSGSPGTQAASQDTPSPTPTPSSGTPSASPSGLPSGSPSATPSATGSASGQSGGSAGGSSGSATPSSSC